MPGTQNDIIKHLHGLVKTPRSEKLAPVTIIPGSVKASTHVGTHFATQMSSLYVFSTGEMSILARIINLGNAIELTLIDNNKNNISQIIDIDVKIEPTEIYQSIAIKIEESNDDPLVLFPLDLSSFDSLKFEPAPPSEKLSMTAALKEHVEYFQFTTEKLMHRLEETNIDKLMMEKFKIIGFYRQKSMLEHKVYVMKKLTSVVSR